MIVGSKELIKDLLSKNDGQISLKQLRKYAIGEIGDYYLVGVFFPRPVSTGLSYQRLEDELLKMKILGQIDIIADVVYSKK